MYRFKLAAIIAVLSAAAASAQVAPAHDSTIAGGAAAEVTQWKGTVVAINPATRWVVLQGPQGNFHTFQVNTGIPNLNKVLIGDTVTVTFVEAIAIYLRQSTDPTAVATANMTTVKPKGMPAVANVTVTEAIVKVTAVDQAARTLTVAGPLGNVVTYSVDPAVKAFSQVKVGDRIVVRYTEAIAIAVTK